jgi:RHS repeat-associated protein
MYGLPIYAAQAGWSYHYAPSNCYLQYDAQGVKINYHCDSPNDDGPNAKGRYLIRRIESCTPAQTPGQGTNLWYINYTYNSPARIANIHNGTDPNDPNSATLQYLYQWEGNTAEISYESRSTTSGTWLKEREWEVTFDEQDRPIKYDAGCSSGCSGSAEFENVTYFDSEDYDLTGYEYLIQEKKDPNGVIVLKNTYTIVDYGYWQQGDWLPLGNMSFELPVVSGCVSQTTSDAIVGWTIEDPTETPNVQVCHDPNESGLHGDQYIRPENHVLEKDFQCYLSPKLQYMLSASIKALDTLNTSRGIIELHYDDGLNEVLLAAIDVNDIATGQLVNGQWEPFSVTIPCPESIVDLTLAQMKLVVTGDYVGIDNLVLASRFWVAGHGKPMVSQQEVYDDIAHDLVTAMTRDFDKENFIVTEKQYTSEFEYRITKYHYTDRTFSRLEKKEEFGSLSYEDPNQTYATTYGGDDPNRIFITHYPSGKRADVQIYGTSGTVIDSYVMDLENDANSLRETYTYQDVEYSEYYEPADWRLKTHTNARGGITTYNYQISELHLLTSQSEPQTIAGSQEVSYVYDNARRVIQETRKLDGSRNLVTTYVYNPTTGFLDSSTVNGATTTYMYNALGQVIRQTNPDGIMTGKSYGLGGELVSEFVLEEHSDPNNADASLYLMSQTRYTYTDSGQIELVGHYKSNGSFPYQSDMISNPNNWIWTCYEYYQDGKKKKSIEDYGTGRTNLTTAYFYNWQGELEKVLYPTGKWVKTYRDGRGLVVLEEVGYGTDTVVLESAYSYDANGNLKQQSNPDGSILVYTYDHYDRLKRTYQGSTEGPYTEKFYNNAGDVIREIACQADETMLSDQRLDYDVLGNVKSQRLCAEPNSLSGTDDLVTHYQYDIAGNLRYEIRAGLENTDPNETPDPNDIITEYRYNDQGRQSIVVDPNGFIYSKYYTQGGLIYKSIDPYDPEDPNAFVTENRFDAYGRLEKTINPMGHYTANTYNSLNQIIRQDIYDCKNPDNPNDDIPVRQVRTLYDNLGHVTQQALMADPNESGDIVLGTDLVTDYVYEPNGLLSEQKIYVGTSATVAKTTFSYDPIGRRILTIDPENNWEQIHYNTQPALGSQVVKTEQYENDPDGNADYTIRTFMLYDNNGRLSARLLDKDGSTGISEEDPNTTFAYDGLGRITHTTAPNSVVALTAYDGFGNVKQTIEDYGTGTENRTTEYIYNRLNQQYQVKAYDPNDTTSHIAVQTTTYAYNPNGLVTQIIYPDQRIVEYEYNLLNKLDTETKRDGTQIYYWYDQLGNLVSESDDPDGWQSTSTPGYLTWFEYDGAGRLKSAYKEIEGQEISESSFTYNGFGARTSETAQYDDDMTQTTYWTYDGSGNVLTQTHGDTLITYTHDGLGRIKTLDKGNDSIVTYSYLGRNTQSIDYPQADTTQQFAYDPLGRVLECKSIDANNLPILDFNYLYDIVGNRKQCAYSHLSTTVYDKYHYDTLNRLWKVEYGQTTPFSYLMEDSIWSMDELVLAASHWLNSETEEWIACTRYLGKRESTQSIQAAAENEVFISQRLKQMESVLKQAGFRNINSFLKSVKSIEAVAYHPDEPIYTLVELGGDIPNNYRAETVYNDNNQLIAQIIWNNKDKMVLFAMYPENGDTIVVSLSYDSKGNLTSDILTTFDANGNVISTEDLLAQEELLAAETMPVASMSVTSPVLMSESAQAMQAKTDAFGYDHLGNRNTVYLNQGVMAQETIDYSHNSVNQYETIERSYLSGSVSSTTSLFYDDNGNLSVDESGSLYFYDYRNRLVEFQNPNSEPLVEYAFDALGRRISKTADSKTTYFFYDTAGRVIAEYEDGTTPTLQKEYVWGNGYNEILAMFTPYHAGDPDDWDDFIELVDAWLCVDPNDACYNGTYDHNLDDIVNFEDFAYFASIWDVPSHDESDWYYLHDALGSVRGLVGGRFKRVSDREFYNYDIYGKLSIQEAQESKSGNPYLFAGYRYDPETGLYHTQFRAYDAGVGRWLQLDPEGYVIHLVFMNMLHQIHQCG